MVEIDERLSAITLKTLKMLEKTIKSLEDTLEAYLKQGKVPSIDDDKIDSIERNVEKECLVLILKERPFSKDLRKVTGIFKLVEDIERLGDHAEDLAWTISHLNALSNGLVVPTLVEEAKVALSMVKNAYAAFAKGDDTLALETIKRDDIVDDLYLESLKTLPTFKEKYSLNDQFILYATLMSKYWERVADHASNIAEWVDYIETGSYKGDEIL